MVTHESGKVEKHLGCRPQKKKPDAKSNKEVVMLTVKNIQGQEMIKVCSQKYWDLLSSQRRTSNVGVHNVSTNAGIERKEKQV